MFYIYAVCLLQFSCTAYVWWWFTCLLTYLLTYPNWPPFVRNKCATIGRSHGKLGHFTPYDVVSRGCGQSLRRNEVRWSEMSDRCMWTLQCYTASEHHWCLLHVGGINARWITRWHNSSQSLINRPRVCPSVRRRAHVYSSPIHRPTDWLTSRYGCGLTVINDCCGPNIYTTKINVFCVCKSTSANIPVNHG